MGDNKEDSLLTVGYDFSKFNFWKVAHSKPELESVYLFDKNVHLPGKLTIGSTTRRDIIQSLGLPDDDHNDPGRSWLNLGTQLFTERNQVLATLLPLLTVSTLTSSQLVWRWQKTLFEKFHGPKMFTNEHLNWQPLTKCLCNGGNIDKMLPKMKHIIIQTGISWPNY